MKCVRNHEITVAWNEAPSGQHGVAHRAGAGRGQGLPIPAQPGHFLADQMAKLAVGTLLAGSMANATPWEKVRAETDIGAILVTPADELQAAVFGFSLADFERDKNSHSAADSNFKLQILNREWTGMNTNSEWMILQPRPDSRKFASIRG